MSAPASLFIGWLAAFGAVAVWSGWIVVSRLGIIQTLTIYDIMALRFFVAAVAIAPFLWRYWPRHLRWWQTVLISLGQGVPYLALAFGGLHFAPASHAGTMMNGTLPIFAFLLGWLFLNDRPDRWRGVGMLAILIGCGLIGRAWTIVFARAGCPVRLWDAAPEVLESLPDRALQLVQ